jgi:hypothetical protein
VKDILNKLNELNPGRNIASVFDDNFKRFGVIHKGFKIDKLLEYLDHNEVNDEIAYTADVPEMREELADQLEPIMYSIYAGMDVQIGMCHGRNNVLNALEYHHGSEVYIHATDMILMVALESDIKWPEGTYDSSLVKSYYVPKGCVVELRSGCMHYAGVNVFKKKGLNLIVSLLKDTNSKINFKANHQNRDKLIIAKNTWLLAHPDYSPAKTAGWHLGITGENISFKTL